MKKLNLIFCLLFLGFNISAQSTKIWVTVEDENQIKTIKSDYSLKNVKKALPDSRRNDLQKVYEFEIEGNYANFIEYIDRTEGLENPEVIEAFTLLQEPNDYYAAFNDDYALDLINAKEAWDITTGSPAVKIGVSDSNFDINQEELEGTVSFMSSNITGSDINHGTAVAITAAGNTDNSVGKSSIGNECKMMLYGMNYNHVLQATYAGARVVNLSWASGCYFNSYYQSVIDEVHENGTVIIAAAGNGPTCGGADNYVYPASFDNVISVSSIGPNNNHQRFPGDEMSTHQHNDSVDLVAPGYDVALGISNNTYLTGNGTSFAAPYVSGTVGLMLSVNPCLSTDEIEMILKSTAVSVETQNPLYVGELGAGRLDAHAAVQMAKELIPIDFNVVVNEASCTNGNTNVVIHLIEGDMNDYNLQWSDGSSEWVRNNLAPGDYNFTISSPNGCSINQNVSFEPTGPYFDYPNSIFINDNDFTLVDSNDDGVINVRGSIIIGNEVEYEINNSTIQFTDNSDLSEEYPNSGVVVKEGASLSIYGSNLSSVNDCTNNWGGIELWSESDNFSTVSIENSTISNAKIGVSNISKFAFNNNLEEEGGHVQVINSTFINSKIGVNIIETLGQQKSHSILNNTFSNIENVLSPTFINLNGSQYISIKDNSFIGSESVDKELRGTAVRAQNTTLNSISTKPNLEEELSFNNIYSNLYFGLDISNSTKNFLELKVYNELFNNVEKCIKINGQYKGELTLNEFNTTSGSSQDEAYGIKLKGDNNLMLTENNFYGESSINNYGMISESNSVGEGLIKLNSFEGSFVNGINFIGANSFDEISCNDFNITGQYDWFIYKKDSGELGSLYVKEELNINNFSESQNVELNLKNHHHNEIFNYRDAYEYMPYEVCESITVEDIQIEIDREKHCYENEEITSITEETMSNDQFEIDDVISIYPNPTNGVIKINNGSNKTLNKVEIMTMEGKVIETISWSHQESVDLTSYSAGTYLVGLQLGSSVKTERVVIQ